MANADKRLNVCLYDAINAYGKEHFIIGVLEVCTTIDELNLKEIEYINEFNTLMPNGYNMVPGGNGGYLLGSWSEERRQNLYKQQALTRTGKKRTQAVKDKLSAAFKNRIIAEHTKKTISNSLKQYYFYLSDDEKIKRKLHMRKIRNLRTYTHHTKAVKEKMAMAKRGKTYYELMSKETADYLLEKRRKHFTENNPTKYDIPATLQQLCVLEINGFLTAQEISEKYAISCYKLRQVYKSIGISNLQKYRHNKKWKICKTHFIKGYNEKTSNN